MPAYHYDPYHYKVHKMKGGSFQNYTDKSYLPLTDTQITKHLDGDQLVGIYPLLQDDTSWFIVADFDDKNWVSDARTFVECCRENNIPANLERSRSGNGAHVWIFFSQAYPAIKSRKIVLALLTKCGVVSAFDKNSSFDRVFPNQDSLSGKRLGNLIALPLYKPAMIDGSSCFIDPQTLVPFVDQWSYLYQIEKVNIEVLDNVYHSIAVAQSTKVYGSTYSTDNAFNISLNNTVRLTKGMIPPSVTTFLRDELNFINSEFIIQQKTGRSSFGTQRYFRFIEETENDLVFRKGLPVNCYAFAKMPGYPFNSRICGKRKTQLHTTFRRR